MSTDKRLNHIVPLLAAVGFCLTFSVPSVADDLNPAPFRGLPGSTVSHWTYDEDAPGDPVFPRLDAPESSSFVSRPGWSLERSIPWITASSGHASAMPG